jgi:hypothetical protein
LEVRRQPVRDEPQYSGDSIMFSPLRRAQLRVIGTAGVQRRVDDVERRAGRGAHVRQPERQRMAPVVLAAPTSGMKASASRLR